MKGLKKRFSVFFGFLFALTVLCVSSSSVFAAEDLSAHERTPSDVLLSELEEAGIDVELPEEDNLLSAQALSNLGQSAPYSSEALSLRRSMARAGSTVGMGLAVASANQKNWSTLNPITTGVHMGVRHVTGNWPGNGYVTIETRASATSASTERLRVAYTWPGTSVQTLVSWRYVDWTPEVSFSGVAPTVIRSEGTLLDGETWQGSYLATSRSLGVYERCGGTYHHTGSYGTGDSVLWAQGESTDENGWHMLSYYDPFKHLYISVDSDSSNKNLSPSGAGVSDLSDWCDEPDGHYTSRRITNAVCHDWNDALNRTDYTESNVDLGHVYPLGGSTKRGISDAGKYVHVTWVSHTGQISSTVIPIPPAYQILYDSQGGSAVSSSAKIFTGYSRNVTSSVPVRDGYTFQGWYSAPNGGGTKYTAGTAITLTSDKTLYAHWKANPKYKITTSVENGTITNSISDIKAGEARTITYSANAGHYLKSITVDGTAVNIGSYPSSYTFSNITADHTISVVYKPYWRIETVIDHGTITPQINNIKAGANHSITYTPAEGRYVSSVLLQHGTDGAMMGSLKDQAVVDAHPDGDTHAVNNVQENWRIEVTTKPYLRIHTAIDHGTITPDIGKIRAGETHTVTWTPAAGRYVSDVEIQSFLPEGGGVALVPKPSFEDAGGSYQFSNMRNDYSISVTTLPYYRIATSVSHGTITPNVENIKVHENRTVSYAPEAGYYLKSVTVDGQAVDITQHPNSYTFSNISADHTIHVVYEPYWKVETEITGGTITPTDNTVKKGESRTVTWAPNDGWFVSSVTIDGVQADANYLNNHRLGGTHVFSNIAENHKVVVVCQPMYHITTKITNGTITPTVNRILPGEDRTITYSPNDGYYVDRVLVDGVSMSLDTLKHHLSNYTFTNIQTNHEIEVVCETIPSITITKELSGECIWEKGSPQFQFVVSGTDRFGDNQSWHRTLTFTMDSGTEQSVTLRIPNGSWTVSELAANDWELKEISASGCGSVGSDRTTMQCTLDGKSADKKLASVTFVNHMPDWYVFTQNDTEINDLK